VRLVWVVFALVFVSIVGIQDSFAEECKPIILDYSITGGEVTEICASQSYSVIVKLEASENGQLIIDIPSNVLASTDRSCTIGAVDYFVLVKGDEVSPVEKIVRGTTIVLTIPFDLGHHEIEIISGINTMSLPNPYNICGHVHGYDKLYLPPAKQIKLGNFLEFIRCNEGLTLIQKTSKDAPVCVKEDSIEKLVERGWSTHGMTSIEIMTDPNVGTGNHIMYKVYGGEVTLIENERRSGALTISIDAYDDGKIVLFLPEQIRHEVFGGADGYLPFVDRKQIDEEKVLDVYLGRVHSNFVIHFDKDFKEIIIGGWVFG